MIDEQTISINFGQGVDTKTDPKMVVSGRLETLQNGIFTKAKTVNKRNGYGVLTTVSYLSDFTRQNFQPTKLIKNYGDKLLCSGIETGFQTQQKLLDYSPTAGVWKSAGAYESMKVENVFISGSNSNESSSSSVVLGNYCLTVYNSTTDVTDFSITPTATFSIMDLNTNTFLVHDMAVPSSGSNATFGKAALIAGTTLAIVFVNATALRVTPIVINDISFVVDILPNKTITLVADMRFYGDSSLSLVCPSYDIAPTPSGLVVSWSSPNSDSIKFAQIDTSGNTTNSSTFASTSLAFPLSLTYDAVTGNTWFYWAAPTSLTVAPSVSESVFYAIAAPNLSSVLSPTLIASGVDYVRQITSQVVNSTTQYFFYSNASFTSGAPNNNVLVIPNVFYGTLNSTGTVVAASHVANVDIYAKPFLLNSNYYIGFIFYSIDQQTGFIININGLSGLSFSDISVAAKFLPGNAEGAYSTEVVAAPGFGGLWWRYPGFLVSPFIYGTKAILSAGKIVSDIIGLVSGTATNNFTMGTVLVSLDPADIDTNQSLIVNNTAILNGGIVSMYDGSAVTELGFHVYPEVQLTPTNTGGFLPNGTYGVQLVAQWTDAVGNTYLSNPSDLNTVTITGSNVGLIHLNAKGMTLTNKKNITFYIYITQTNGTIPYLAGIVANDPLSPLSHYIGAGSFDLNLAAPIYTSNGAILGNFPPPPSVNLWVNNNRLWASDSENPQTDVWYSKTISNGNGIEFSDQLIYSVDSRLGEIKAGIGMDEKTILIKKNGIMVFLGDGANDAGTGSSFSNVQVIPSDVGGIQSRGTILIPSGVMFKTSKGIYLFSRGSSVEYIGYPVESYNSQDIQSATMLANVNQVRFLTSSGLSLVYDYFFNQWSTFTNHQGYSADIWQGNYAYVRTDNSIYVENGSTFLDNATAYAMSMTTAWIKASSIQNFQRVRAIELLGQENGSSPHGVQLSVAYDFVTTLTQTGAFYLTGSNAPFQYKISLPRQKCDSLQLFITELTTGASGESISLSDMAMEIGVKRGMNKLPASKSVG